MAKTYTTVPDKAVRDAFSESMWDTMIAQNINNLIVPPLCRVSHSVVQVITSAVTTQINFDTEAYDNDSMHDTVTNNQRITPTTSGVYVVTTSGVWSSGGTTGGRNVTISLNGTTPTAEAAQVASSQLISSCVSSALNLNGTTDYVVTTVSHNQGANQNYDYPVATDSRKHMSAVWIGRTA